MEFKICYVLTVKINTIVSWGSNLSSLLDYAALFASAVNFPNPGLKSHDVPVIGIST